MPRCTPPLTLNVPLAVCPTPGSPALVPRVTIADPGLFRPAVVRAEQATVRGRWEFQPVTGLANGAGHAAAGLT